MKVVILVPRREGNAHRDRLWRFCKEWWGNDHPEWEIHEGHHYAGPFNRSAAINMAAEKAGDWDVAVIIDSDVLADANLVKNGVELALSTNRMVNPYNERVMLSQAGTEEILGGFRGSWRSEGMVDESQMDAVSNVVIVSRTLWDKVGGFDEHFHGWGWEDVAFRCACETLSGQDILTMAGPVWHLWHETEAGKESPLLDANLARINRYREARWNRDLMVPLISESHGIRNSIPRRLIRTVPEVSSPEVEAYWETAKALHPDWDHVTFRDPIDPERFPISSPHWDKCSSGAQLAGLIRLEALYSLGGFYIDSDLELFRSLEELCSASCVAGWEDENTIPDLFIAARPCHPAIKECLDLAIQRLYSTSRDWRDDNGAWSTGPGVLTTLLPGREDVLLLSPDAFCPVHYTKKRTPVKNQDIIKSKPWCFGRHWWNASWLPEDQR